LPSEQLNERKFWSIVARHPVKRKALKAAEAAVSEDRDDRDAGLPGR
jgi:hypothetical protein